MAITYRTAPQEQIKWTEQLVTARLVAGEGSAFPYRRYLCIPNVSWGFLEYEADLLAVSQTGWLTEIEIKVSVADLRNDAKKRKHEIWAEPDNPVSQLIYAMPVKVWEAVKENPPIPEYAGVLVLHDVNVTSCHEWKKAPTKRKGAKPITEEQRACLSRLGVMRFWSLIHKQGVAKHV